MATFPLPSKWYCLSDDRVVVVVVVVGIDITIENISRNIIIVVNYYY